MTYGNTYLALGDSYTVGEGVPLYESYPCQAVQLVRRQGKKISGPEIIAKTGWTTSELYSHLDHTLLNPPYNAVSLLIGVNDQYRGMPASNYQVEFTELLHTSITLADNQPSRVVVLSIPDWGKSPFASGKDSGSIADEIAVLNRINREISLHNGCNYLDITAASPEISSDLTMFADDGLHPSGKAYGRWATLLAVELMKIV